MHVYTYVYLYMCEYVHLWCLCVYVYIYIYVNVCMCVCIYMCMYMYVYVYMYIYVCVCMYIYIYTHTKNFLLNLLYSISWLFTLLCLTIIQFVDADWTASRNVHFELTQEDFLSFSQNTFAYLYIAYAYINKVCMMCYYLKTFNKIIKELVLYMLC